MKRFQYHFEPKTGWMNDPNGLIHWNGTYHAFFQYFPYDTRWGIMHWGHATSEDLIHWKEEPIALVPNESYENAGGCFSGSAIVKDDTLYLFYTSVSRDLHQAQSMAWSKDGIHFHKYEGNPVIRESPFGISDDFRDPKVFAYGDEYRMITGSRRNGHGLVLQYRSSDLIHWDYMGVLYESAEYTMTCECPDLFPVDGRWVLMYSKMIQPGYQTQFIVGDYDGTTFVPSSFQSPEAGPQFYAPQSFESENGRRVLIGWMYDWTRKAAPGAFCAGALSVPREVHLNAEGQLRIYPVDEAWDLLKSLEIQFKDDSPVNQCQLKGIQVYALEDRVTVSGCDPEETTDPSPFTYYGPIHSVEVLEDAKAVEIFVNGGAINMARF